MSSLELYLYNFEPTCFNNSPALKSTVEGALTFVGLRAELFSRSLVAGKSVSFFIRACKTVISIGARSVRESYEG